MSGVSAGPKLYKKKSASTGQAFFYIRDGSRRTATGIRDDGTSQARAKAREALKRYLTEEDKRAAESGERLLTVAEAVEYYVERRGAAVKSRQSMAHSLTPIVAFMGQKVCDKLTTDDGFRYQQWRTHRGPIRKDEPPRPQRVAGDSTARRDLAILNAVLAMALKAEKISRRPTFDLPESAPAKERWLTHGEAARLLMGALGFVMVSSSDLTTRTVRWRVWRREASAVNRHVARFIVIGLYTGTRHRAICRLGFAPHPNGGHFDLTNGVMYRRALGTAQSKKRTPPIRLDPYLTVFVRRWQRMTNSPYVIHYRDAGARPRMGVREEGEFDGLDEIGGGFRLACQRAGLGPDVTPHVLRHTCVTWLLQRGWSVWDVAGYVGMSPAIVENVYGHHSTEFMRSVGLGVR